MATHQDAAAFFTAENVAASTSRAVLEATQRYAWVVDLLKCLGVW